MPVFSYLLNIRSGVVYHEKGKEYPWQMPWILVNDVDSKMRVFSYFHNKWKADGGRDDENMKIIVNKQNNDTMHFI